MNTLTKNAEFNTHIWLPAAGAAVGGAGHLLFGRDPSMSKSDKRKQLLRSLLLGGIVGGGLDASWTGGNMMLKGMSLKSEVPGTYSTK